MSAHEDSKHLVLWASVALASLVILTGWIFSLKYNFNKINAELNSQTSDQTPVATQVQAMFDDFSQVMDEQEKLRLANLPAQPAPVPGLEVAETQPDLQLPLPESIPAANFLTPNP